MKVNGAGIGSEISTTGIGIVVKGFEIIYSSFGCERLNLKAAYANHVPVSQV